MDRRSIFIIGSYADVPLSEHRRLVALLAEHAGQGQAIRGNQTGSPHPGKDSLVIETKGHAPSEHAVPGGRANRGRAVGIRKKHPLLGQPVEVGRGDFRLGVIAGEVSVTQVVRENENDVRMGLGSGRNARKQKPGPCQGLPASLQKRPFNPCIPILLFICSYLRGFVCFRPATKQERPGPPIRAHPEKSLLRPTPRFCEREALSSRRMDP